MNRTPTLLRAMDAPLGLYFRVGQNDHRAFEQTLTGGMPGFSGAVFDASRTRRHADLRAELRRQGLEAVLDPMALEMATPGGWERNGLRKLPWAGKAMHRPEQFDRDVCRRLADKLVEFAVKNKYTAIVAPTHYVADGVNDPWWNRDRETFVRLTEAVRAGSDANRLLRPSPQKKEKAAFGSQARVYIERLGVFLKPDEARALFARSGMKGRFGCQAHGCCRSIDDMVREPTRHFLTTRAREVASLSQIPRHDRATVYMERFLRRASDDAFMLASIDPKKFGRVDKRLRGWRAAFGKMLDERVEERTKRKADVIPLRRR